MHELALAEAVVAIAEEHARGRRVARVELEVGGLRQVVPQALSFSFALVAAGTAAAGAELAIEEVPASVRCRACGGRSEVEAFPFACARCGSLDVDVAGGDELRVVALELEALSAPSAAAVDEPARLAGELPGEMQDGVRKGGM
jgi:hydrogenase nickel incorporation protein HypA/HybF